MTQFRVRHVRPVGDDQHAQHVVAGGPEQRPFRRAERDHQRRHAAQDVGNDRQRQRAATFGHAHSSRPETEVRPPRGSTRQQLRSCRRPSAVGNRSRQKTTRISTLSAIDRERKWFGSGGFEMSAIVSERVPPLATPTRRPETVVVTARHVNRAVARRRRQSVSVEIPETRIASFDYRISTTDRPTDRPETEVVRQDVGDGEREESNSSGALHAIVERRSDATSRHDDHVHRVTDDTHNTQRTAAQEQTGTGRMRVVIRV